MGSAARIDYANCVNVAALKLASQPDGVLALARSAVDDCHDLRTKAPALKGAPVMFPTIAEYDAMHFGIAKEALEKLRTK